MDAFAFGPKARSHRKAIFAGLVIGISIAAVVATAVQVINGTGFGRGKSGVWASFVIVPDDAAAVGELIPGGNANVAFSFTNTFPGPVVLTSISPGSGALVRYAASPAGTGANAPECQITINQAALNSILSGPAIAGGATPHFNVSDALTMGATPADTCQSKSFDISLALTAQPSG
jgi:hypothetical protein